MLLLRLLESIFYLSLVYLNTRIVFAQRRRYAAMELADTWRVKRAFAPWRARIGAAHFSDDVENTAPPVAVGEIEWQRF